MNERSLSDVLDEFSPGEPGEVIDDEPLPVPLLAPKRRKKRKGHHPDQVFRCPCPDCLRQRPGRAAEIAEKKAGK
jgi:hypothetical protein